MKKHVFCYTLFLSTLYSSVFAQTSEDEAIKRVIQQETSSYEAGKFDDWASFWVHEPYVLWVFNQPDAGFQKATGWDELSKQMKVLMTADNSQGSEPKPAILRENYVVHRNGLMAFVTFEQTRMKSPIRTRESRVLEKKGNDWKLIHSSTFIPWNIIKASATPPTNQPFRKGTYAITNGSDKASATFGDDGRYVVNLNNALAAAGTYAVTGDTIVVTDVDGPMSCKGMTGSYKWALNDKSLTFIKLDDVCAGRVNGFTRQAWTQE